MKSHSKKHSRPHRAASNQKRVAGSFSLTDSLAEKIFTVRIERILPGGLGLAYAEGHTVLVALAAPEDVLRVQVERVRGKVLFASIIEILEPSASRVTAPCRYFGVCGGCDFQQLDYEAQLKAKVGIVRDTLRRIARITEPLEIAITPAPRPFNYRTRATWQRDATRHALGYFARASHEICDIKDCLIIAAALQKELTDARLNFDNFDDDVREIRASLGDGDEVAVLTNNQSLAEKGALLDDEPQPANVDLAARPTNELTANELTKRIGDEIYRYDAACFFQVNHDLLPALIAEALRYAAPHQYTSAPSDNNSLQLTETHENLARANSLALDLYCGVGLFTLPLARRFAQTIGIEAHTISARYGSENLRRANLRQARIECSDVEAWLTEDVEYLTRKQVEFALLDPPRAGAEAGTIAALLEIKPARIAYVSCDPATLGRDLRLLLASNQYQLTRVHALDMFEQTHHVESVAHLELRR